MLKKLLFILLIFLFLTGCSGSAPKAVSTQIFAMDTVMDFTVYTTDDTVSESASRLVFDLEQKLSVTDKNSQIYQLNRTGKATLSPDTAELLEKALNLCKKTEGILDLSVYPVLKAWGFTTGHYQIPSERTIQELLAHVDYKKIKLQGDTVTLPEKMAIDLGSVAKGYTGDRLISLLKESGISSALLNLGGNVQALGRKPDGSRWKVGLQDPCGEGYLGVLAIADQAVITSGGYQRYFEGDDGKIYWHILDSSTGKPARSGLLSATAVGTEGIYCDALSTALFIMGPERAVSFWKENQDFDMILVTEDRNILITPGISEFFHLTDGSSDLLQVIGYD